MGLEERCLRSLAAPYNKPFANPRLPKPVLPLTTNSFAPTWLSKYLNPIPIAAVLTKALAPNKKLRRFEFIIANC